MGLADLIHGDLNTFFNTIEKQNYSDQRNTLKLLLEKYAQLSTSNVSMDNKDLMSIVGTAKLNYSDKTFPVFLGDDKRRVPEDSQANLCVIEATIMHLNHKDCFKKIPKFDYKADKF